VDPEDRTCLARERVGRDRIAKREPVLGIKPVLVLGRRAPGMPKRWLANTLPAPATWLKNASGIPDIVHAELGEMPQKPPALRDAGSQRVADAGTLGPLRFAA
jgi:hypothetical protein